MLTIQGCPMMFGHNGIHCREYMNSVNQLLNEDLYLCQIEDYISKSDKPILSYLIGNQVRITATICYDEYRKTVHEGRYSQQEFEHDFHFYFYESLRDKIKGAIEAMRKEVKEDVCVRDICREKSLLEADLEEYDGCNFQETQIMIELNPKDK